MEQKKLVGGPVHQLVGRVLYLPIGVEGFSDSLSGK